MGSIIFNKYKEQVLVSWAFKWGDNYIELFALEVGHFPPLLSIILLFCESLFSNLLFYLLYLSRQELKIFTTLKGTVMQIVSNFFNVWRWRRKRRWKSTVMNGTLLNLNLRSLPRQSAVVKVLAGAKCFFLFASAMFLPRWSLSIKFCYLCRIIFPS